MSASPNSSSPVLRSAIADRLRVAGCVFAEDEADLLVTTAQTSADLVAMVDRRVAGEPLEHVLGWVSFCGLRLTVDPGVFVPRRRTEFLVQQAATLAGPGAVVVDLCCGSGAVGAALAAAIEPIELHAVDLDPAAVRCARRNLEPAGGRVYEGDLYQPLPSRLRGRVDLVVANAPYVPTDAIRLMPPEARLHEPRSALDGGTDGLEILRRMITGAPPWLAPGGHLIFEANTRQAPLITNILTDHGLDPRVCHSDEFDTTVVIATAPTA